MGSRGRFVDTPMSDMIDGARLAGSCLLETVGVSAQRGPAPESESRYDGETKA